MINNVFFLDLAFTQFDCKSKESREGRGIFFAKKGLGGGGIVEKEMLQRIYNGSHIHRDWFSAGHQCTGVNYLGSIAERPNGSNPKFQSTIYFSSYNFLRAQNHLCFDD